MITGASSGLGRATALRLASQGVQVALAARTQDKLEEIAGEIRDLGGQALVLPTDVTQAEECRRAVEETVRHFGKLDILLCLSGWPVVICAVISRIPIWKPWNG